MSETESILPKVPSRLDSVSIWSITKFIWRLIAATILATLPIGAAVLFIMLVTK